SASASIWEDAVLSPWIRTRIMKKPGVGVRRNRPYHFKRWMSPSEIDSQPVRAYSAMASLISKPSRSCLNSSILFMLKPSGWVRRPAAHASPPEWLEEWGCWQASTAPPQTRCRRSRYPAQHSFDSTESLSSSLRPDEGGTAPSPAGIG